MKKTTRKMISMLLAFALIAGTAGCAQSTGTSTELEIPYSFASKEEGEELLMSNTEYFDGMTRNDWEFRLGKKRGHQGRI